MAYTNPVADFVSSLDSFYESVSIDDLEKVVGPIDRGNLIEKADTSSIVSINELQSIADTDIDEECFHDVMESTGEFKKVNVHKVNQYLKSSKCIDDIMTSNHIPISHQNGINEIELQYSMDDFKLQITNTVTTMKLDLDIITNRVAQIELKLNEIKTRKQTSLRSSYNNVYPMIFLIGWPIIIQLIFIWLKRRNKQKA